MCEPTIEKYKLLEKLTKLGLTEIIYSLTVSLTRDGAVTFDNITDFLTNLSKISGLSFHYCLTMVTAKDLGELDDILSKVEFKNLSFLRYVEHGRGKDDLTISSKELRELKPIIIKFIEKYGDKIHLGSPYNILNITNTPCTAGSKTMIIGFDGNAYPCDAMKYFDYMGSGGNIYESSLLDIYQSNYFRKVREASCNIHDDCINCSQDKCQGGCLAQKMLDIVKRDDSVITTRWYQENALRTMNCFENRDLLMLNAYTGICGKYGEFFDYMKKFYTHNLSEEKRRVILEMAPKELGDLVWYLSTTLALVYDYTLEDVYDYLFNMKNSYYNIDANLIRKASQSKDPLCLFRKDDKTYSVDAINLVVVEEEIEVLDEMTVFRLLKQFKIKLNGIDYVESREDAIEVVADIMLEIVKMLKVLFNKKLSEVLNDNINKLRERYPEGFDTDVANLRIDANKKYKEENSEIVPKRRILQNKELIDLKKSK